MSSWYLHETLLSGQFNLGPFFLSVCLCACLLARSLLRSILPVTMKGEQSRAGKEVLGPQGQDTGLGSPCMWQSTRDLDKEQC